MMVYLQAFAAMFVMVGLRAFQQQNVIHRKWWWVMPTSMGMAGAEVYIYWQASIMGPGWLAVALGFGGGSGCLAAMWAHGRLNNER